MEKAIIIALAAIPSLLGTLIAPVPHIPEQQHQTAEEFNEWRDARRKQRSLESYDAYLNSWLDKLVHFESSGRWDVEILDTNDKMSRGCLQFQDATWESYSSRYGIEGTPLNCDTARAVAMEMIKEDPNNWRHWYNSTKKMNLYPEAYEEGGYYEPL